MPPPSIPVLRVAGSHADAGAAIGRACAEAIHDEVAFDAAIPGGRDRSEQLALADRYAETTYAAYPWYREELDALAEAAGADPRAVFARMVEEIWYEPYAARLEGRCTDVVAVPPATAEDRVLVGHNNDMRRAYQDRLVAIEWALDGEPAQFTIGNGLWVSCGWNANGVSMTGNELAPLDERIGIPREIQFRSMLRQPSLDGAIAEGLREDRASSYNHVVVDATGRAIDLEGSATDAELTGADERGHLVHTNHYVCDRMVRYEGDPGYRPNSAARYERARALLSAIPPGTATTETLRAILSDHDGEPNAICRHPERYGGTSATAFWWIADLTANEVAFGRGNPCDSVAQTHRFERAAAPA